MIVSIVTAPVTAAIARGSIAHSLSDPELRRYRLLEGPRKLDFLAGRVALKAALRCCHAFAGGDVRQLVVENDPDGRPRVVQRPDLSCSLAHSGAWGAGAVADRPVGVDVERVRPRSAEILRHIADDTEREAAGAGSGEVAQVITRIWTLKEAVLKGMGVGLAVAPKHLKLREADGDAFIVEVSGAVATECSRWRAWTFAVEDFCISVATGEETRERPAIRWYHPPGLHAPGDPLLAVRA